MDHGHFVTDSDRLPQLSDQYHYSCLFSLILVLFCPSVFDVFKYTVILIALYILLARLVCVCCLMAFCNLWRFCRLFRCVGVVCFWGICAVIIVRVASWNCVGCLFGFKWVDRKRSVSVRCYCPFLSVGRSWIGLVSVKFERFWFWFWFWFEREKERL